MPSIYNPATSKKIVDLNVNFILYSFVGYICDVTGKYDYVFYVSSLASMVCGFGSILLYAVDKARHKDGDSPLDKTIEISVITKP